MEEATVSKLLEAVCSVMPPNAKVSPKDELPLDPEAKETCLKLIKERDVAGFLSLLQLITPDKANKVYENIYIGGATDVKVLKNSKLQSIFYKLLEFLTLTFQNLEWLKSEGITEILNVADSSSEGSVPDLVGTYTVDRNAYEGINYHGHLLSDAIDDTIDEEYEAKLLEAVSKLESIISLNVGQKFSI